MEVREKLFSEKQTGSKDWAKSEERRKKRLRATPDEEKERAPVRRASAPPSAASPAVCAPQSA